MTVSHPSVSEGPIYSTKIRGDHKKHREGDVSSSSGPVYRPGSFMVFFHHGQEGFFVGGMIQVWTLNSESLRDS